MLALALLLAVQSHFLDTSDDVELWWTERGKGSPVVVIHGGPGMDHMSLRPDLAPLEATHRVIYYDQRGGGRSSLPKAEGALTIEKHVDDLESLRRALKLEKLTIVAHSFGPAIAARYAIRYPQRVKAMVFLGPVPPRRADFGARYGRTLSARVSEADRKAADAFGAMMSSQDPATVVAGCRGYWKIMTPPRVATSLPVSVVKSDLCTSPSAAIRFGWNVTNPATFGSLGEWDWTKELAAVTARVLVIHGEEDAIPMDLVNEWVTSLPNARMLRLAQAAHFPHAERPDLVFPAIETFLRGGWPSAAKRQ
jgi:proline iminopeptidase